MGLLVKPNEEITVSVSAPTGSPSTSLLMGTYSRYDRTYTPQEFPLTTTGPRTITNPTAESQLLYIRYIGVTPGGKATVTVEGGWRAPFFVLGESTSESFSEQLKNYEAYVDVQLMGERTIIVISKNIALKYVNQDWSVPTNVAGLWG